MNAYSKIVNIKRNLNRYHLALLVSVLIYILVWSIISIDRIYSMQSLINDLGFNFEKLWLASRPYDSSFTGVGYLLKTPIVFLFSPVAIFGNFEVALIVQTLFLAFPAFFIFGIARYFIGKNRISLLISVLYLIYFPLAGVNWYDFHFQAFFIFFFLGGYYFYIKDSKILSFVLFTLSGMERVPYIIFPLFFVLVTLLLNYVNRDKYELTKRSREWRYSISLFLVLLTLFLVELYLTPGGATYIVTGNVNLGPSAGLTVNSVNKTITLLLIFAPFLFIPFLSKKWILFYIPFIVEVIYSNYWAYDYPYLFHYQYSSGIIPFVFLGFIDGLSNIEKLKEVSKKKLHRYFGQIKKIKLPYVSLVIVVILALFFQPYGPLNHDMNYNYDLKDVIHYNSTSYKDLNSIVDLIPANSPYVLAEANIPEVFPRQLPSDYLILPSTGTGISFGNITKQAVANNSYPIQINQNTVVNIKIDYLVCDLNATWYKGGHPSMQDIVELLSTSSYYNLSAISGQFSLLERGYKGDVRVIDPLFESIPLKTFTTGSFAPVKSQEITSTNITNEFLDHGPGISLFPGSYNVTFKLTTTNLSVNNMALLSVVSHKGTVVWSSSRITGANFTSTTKEAKIRLHTTLTRIVSNAEFIVYIYDWQGSVSLNSVTLQYG